jgi:crotonobetainyl-CoA:carnitine CoA-transferase CaiB-like acyl-CoA transferase
MAGQKGGQRKPPLEGIRVLDITWVAAGPSAAMLLALQGADVIRIEAAGRPDLATFVDNPSTDPDRGPVYQSLNLCKRNISVDLKDPDGVEIARKLALTADVVLESMRPGRVKALGLVYDELRAQKPDLVMASLSGFGQVGPESGFGGYAPIFAASGGLSHLTGYPDGIPTEYRGTADMRTGLSMLVAVLAALRRAKRTGVGAYIDLAGVEASACIVAEAIIDTQMNGRDPGRVGNDDKTMAPHGAYECARDQSFLTIACRDDADWTALKGLLPELEQVPGCETARGRWRRRHEVDQALRPLVRRWDRDELATALQRVGVPAVPCMSNKDIYEDAHLHERGAWVCVHHPVQGERWVMGLPWTTSRIGRGVEPCPSPLQGQYSREVLAEIGIEGEAADRLISRGVIQAAD